MKFNVSLDIVPRIPILLEIEAKDINDAEEQATELVLSDPKYRVLHPVNGDSLEILADDIDVIEITDGVTEN